jgi:DNA-3-methyladenine glycosylase II
MPQVQQCLLNAAYEVPQPMLAPSAPAPDMQGDSFSLQPAGAFSLREAAMFGFGQRHDDMFDGCMRLCFCLDGYSTQVGVAVHQAAGRIIGTVTNMTGQRAPVVAVANQVARVLSLDRDARGYLELVERDRRLAPLAAAAPGLRPPLFYSPYEAALWSVMSARRPLRIAVLSRQCLSQAVSPRFEIAGRVMWSAPLPHQLCEIGAEGIAAACGIDPQRARRVLAVAEAALQGQLSACQLVALPLHEARQALQQLPGIGPFYAELVLIRSTGVTDILPVNEPRFLALLGALHGFARSATPQEAEQLALDWSPWRTWVAVLVRAASSRVGAGHRQRAIFRASSHAQTESATPSSAGNVTPGKSRDTADTPQIPTATSQK